MNTNCLSNAKKGNNCKYSNFYQEKMKTKFLIVFFALIVSYGTSSLYAQTTTTEGASDQVTLNIRLKAIQTLLVNSGQKVVNLDYNTTSDYANGVSSDQADHLTIYSTGGFEIKAKSSSAALTNDGGKNIEVSDIKITASKGATNKLIGVDYLSSALSADGTTIVKSDMGGVNQTFNIKYQSAGADKYINHYKHKEDPTYFTTTVTYTIYAK